MALKCFISGIFFGYPGDEDVNISTYGSPVFDSSIGEVLRDSSGNPIHLNGGTHIGYSDNLSTIRYKMINDSAFGLITYFNSLTGRTDGNTIQFIWLDDRGIL